MTSSNPPNFSRQILLLAAGIFLLAAPQGALAKHKDHSDDHGGMSSNDSSEDHGDKPSEDPKNKVSEKHKGKHKEESADDGMDSEKQKSKHKDKESAENGMDSEKHNGKHKDEESAENGMDSEEHQGKDKEHAEKTTDTEQDNTTGAASTANSNTPAADGDLFGRGVVGRTPTDIKPIPSSAAPGASATMRFARSPSPTVRGALFKSRIMGQA